MKRRTNTSPVVIDGSAGEGGGQVLRTSLALSAATGRPVVIEHVRAGRQKPGLQPQHLAAVKAVARLCDGDVRGAERGSTRVELRPGTVTHEDRVVRIGTAGSATLVAHAVAPALLVTPGRSRLAVEGGTHNPLAPSFDHVDLAFVAALRALDASITASIEEAGFVPEGGGRVVVEVAGGSFAAPPSSWLLPGAARVERVIVWLGRSLPDDIAAREVAVVRAAFGEDVVADVRRCQNTGNAVSIVCRGVESGVVDVVTALGARRRAAEDVAAEAVAEVRAHVASGVSVGPHLADQLLLPLALGAGGRFLTVTPTLHTTTNARVIEQFLDDVGIDFEEVGDGRCVIAVNKR